MYVCGMGWEVLTHNNVRVSSDGRGEVCVVVQSQAIVSKLVWGCAGMVCGHSGMV